MKKNDCNVIRDLMPLVLDCAASDESRELVENHIAACGECREQYDAMKSALPESARAEYEEEQKQFTEALKAVRKKRLKRRIRLIALTACLCLAAVLAGLFVYDALFWKYTSVVDNSLYSLSLAETKNGRYIVTADMSRIHFNTMTECSDVAAGEEYISYICLKTTPVHASGQNSFPVSKQEIMCYENDGEEEIAEIRQGTPGSYVTIWKKGESIPAASEEMEKYFALQDAYWEMFEALPVTEDGKVCISDPEFYAWHDKLEDASLAVPEWK